MRLRVKLAAALAAGLAVLTAAPAGAATQALPKNGDLAVVAYWDSLAIQKSPATLPYTVVTEGMRPKFSPDGKQVAFVRMGHVLNEGDGIYIRTLVSGFELLIHRYPELGQKHSLAWSPDAKSLAVADEGKLDRITIATGAASTIWSAPAGTRLDAPAWSPDGSRIAFSTGNAIKLVHPDGTNLRTLTSSAVGVTNNYPDWSPDSQKIAFITNRYRGAEHSELVTLPRSGAGTPFRVSYNAYPQGIFYIGTAWSPDGKKIAALQFNRNALPDPVDTDERFKVRAYLPDGTYSYSMTGPIAGDDGPEGLDWAPLAS